VKAFIRNLKESAKRDARRFKNCTINSLELDIVLSQDDAVFGMVAAFAQRGPSTGEDRASETVLDSSAR